MKERYPRSTPSTRLKHLRLATSNRKPEFGATREAFEERIFRCANHFNVVRFGVPSGSEIKTVKTFSEAIYNAHGNPRALIYAVALSGDAFCISKTEYGKYAEVWLSMRRSS